jgi:hypothetical protein
MKQTEGVAAVLTGRDAEPYLRTLCVNWPHRAVVVDGSHVSDICRSFPCFPAVVKAEGMSHRNQSGAVWTNISSYEEAEVVVMGFITHFGLPVSISEQIPHSEEFILGGQRRTPKDQLLCLFGRGGVTVDDQVTYFLSPLQESQLLAELRDYVDGANYQKDLSSAVLSLEASMKSGPAQAAEAIDLNPVVFHSLSHQLFALDAKVFIRSDLAP